MLFLPFIQFKPKKKLTQCFNISFLKSTKTYVHCGLILSRPYRPGCIHIKPFDKLTPSQYGEKKIKKVKKALVPWVKWLTLIGPGSFDLKPVMLQTSKTDDKVRKRRNSIISLRGTYAQKKMKNPSPLSTWETLIKTVF